MENILNAEARLSDPCLAYFADRGHTGVRRIGAGAEGVVHRLGGGRAAHAPDYEAVVTAAIQLRGNTVFTA
ncbi:hypothetical protein [Streptomyces sp. NPDC029674]|uniref:hypothetical protein n=1 Tax=Streptomyces sp. NPDC029674 TaxID=3365297 RepID=UPI00384EA6EE